jgi:hypothetical protein
MQLGDTIATYDVAQALRGEDGKFYVTSPTGDVFHVTCKPNQSITNLQWAGNESTSKPFWIRKITELVVALDQSHAGETDTTQDHSSQVPFLVSTEVSQSLAAEVRPVPMVREDPPASAEVEEVLALDLLYEDVGSNSERPLARVCVSRDSSSDRKEWITGACSTFNELDAEIRRLHARLEDIRYRARKKFYEAQAIAAGA